MSGQQCGFSLVEALISVLVLSIGLLGLGQLQAGLWKSAAQLYASTDAYLLSASQLEFALPTGTTQPETETFGEAQSSSGYTVFDSVVQAERRGRHVHVRAATRWHDTDGEQEVRLRTAFYQSAASDSRWLLAPDG
jgi:hypothetical protein